ncbi:MAG: 30S ribosomal protein S4 [Candidatus Magasanikbacteria bacterium RIFOXYD2_FULL_41_14]|uniref:Small ribosomal subunit protein uS4 n=1 Tax=Candidatus Magasanikbacteria bacterium RIFOXYD2_FULL_41_14 TaxID=1798709 RepID=A0A1F6PFR6_9BACT|nr:MAG: 30S ribosomal protein S4 [Candidatus Magasanikbacteria bacterium RIFOXYD2_FULL_41_14]
MARDLRPKHKLCRQYGAKLCDSPKCPVTRRSYPPGQHGQSKRRPKVSEFGKQLKEKQKVRRIYGLLERQFSNYVAEAAKKTGDTSIFLVQYLEARLDNVVFRLGLAPSRAAARQLVSHGHITVNLKKLDIPSYRTKVGDVIGVHANSTGKKVIENVKAGLAKVEPPSWLSLDAVALTGKVLNTPTLALAPFDAKVIIEFYSR